MGEDKNISGLVDINTNQTDNIVHARISDPQTMLSIFLNNTKELNIVLDAHYNIQFINDNAKKQFFNLYHIELQKGQNFLEVAPKEKQLFIKEIYDDVLKGNYRETESSHNVDGNIVYLHNSFRPASIEEGKIFGIIITTRDITAFKKNQIDLEEAQLRWQFASEGSNQGLWDWNIQTGYTYYSKSYKQLYGFDDNDLESHINEWSSRIHPEDIEITTQALEKHFSKNEPTYDSTYRIKAKDGSYRWILSRGMIVSRDKEGKPLRMIGTHTDITRYKITEANYKLLFYSNPLPMWTIDLKTLQFLEVNNRAVEYYGYTREEFLRMTLKDIYPPEDQLEQNLAFEKNKQSFHYAKSNTKHQKKDGTLIYVDITGHIIEQDGKMISLITCQDVTDKLIAEKRLQDSEGKYRSLFINNPLPSWIYHTETQQFLEVNDAAVAHYGYSKEEFKLLTIKDIHPKEERAVVPDAVKEAVKKQNSFSTWKHQKKNGDIIYVDVISSRIDYQNREARLVVIHDKTIEVKAKSELLQSNERFQLATLASS
ncbi:MAG TPA: PAS domain S-box protein, partial [Flavisolibacter sp.]|nr:PAS domain S-box protein [Flavisolibacter sp.]